MSVVKLPSYANDRQIEMYNKNCELRMLAIKNIGRYGMLYGMTTGLGDQDLMFTYDEKRFINVYPYNHEWYNLAYGKNYEIINDEIINDYNDDISDDDISDDTNVNVNANVNDTNVNNTNIIDNNIDDDNNIDINDCG